MTYKFATSDRLEQPQPSTYYTVIHLEQAIAATHEFAQGHYSADELKTLRLEEVELSDDRRFWIITLGWAEPAVRAIHSTGSIMAQNRSDIVPLPRVYKQFRVDSETGEVVSMKIRES